MDRPRFTIAHRGQKSPTRYLPLIAVLYDMSEKLCFLTGYSMDPFLESVGWMQTSFQPLSLSKAVVRAVRGSDQSPGLKLRGYIFTAVESSYLFT